MASTLGPFRDPMMSRITILVSSFRNFTVSYVSEIERWECCHLDLVAESLSILGLPSTVLATTEELSFALGWTGRCHGGEGSSILQFTAMWPSPPQCLQVRRWQHSEVLWVERRQWLQLSGDRGRLILVTGRKPCRGKRMALGLSEFRLRLYLRKLDVSQPTWRSVASFSEVFWISSVDTCSLEGLTAWTKVVPSQTILLFGAGRSFPEGGWNPTACCRWRFYETTLLYRLQIFHTDHRRKHRQGSEVVVKQIAHCFLQHFSTHNLEYGQKKN